LTLYWEKIIYHTFYVHNLGRFDSVFIIDNITKSEKYEIKGIWKAEENKILTIKIINKFN